MGNPERDRSEHRNYLWIVPLGVYSELAAAGMKGTGTENYGGPIVTAGGLVFIGATNFDRKFRAFDKRSAACFGKRHCRWPAMPPRSLMKWAGSST